MVLKVDALEVGVFDRRIGVHSYVGAHPLFPSSLRAPYFLILEFADLRDSTEQPTRKFEEHCRACRAFELLPGARFET